MRQIVGSNIPKNDQKVTENPNRRMAKEERGKEVGLMQIQRVMEIKVYHRMFEMSKKDPTNVGGCAFLVATRFGVSMPKSMAPTCMQLLIREQP